MDKKILLAVDGSIHSTNAVTYAVRMATVVSDLTYTLFHVQPTLSQYLLDEAETDLKARAELKKIIQKNTELAQRVLEKHKARMVRMGIKEERIETSTQIKIMGICKDILDGAQKGLFDAIVVGRRGLSRIQETLMGSITTKLVEHSRVIPLWIVDGDVTSMKLLLAVDGSEASLRAVDHLCFMVGGNEEAKATLVHVKPKFRDYCAIDFDDKEGAAGEVMARGEKRCIDRFYAQALDKFKEVGLSETQIEISVTKPTMDVAKAIVTQAKKGKYGTIVVGRTGTSNAFFMGSVSRHILNKISDSAAWLVP
ncbi:MAG: universal stress protein [Thermodesulfobacteriota bacterium]|nr:universal stress protein [Thermodesulfobacteriota bacterium]